MIFPERKWLVTAYNVQGVNTHDTRIAAVAITAKVPNLLTFNFKHFRRFAHEGLNAVDPATIAAPSTQATP